MLGLLFQAHERALSDGRRTANAQLDYQTFYNDAVNQEVQLARSLGFTLLRLCVLTIARYFADSFVPTARYFARCFAGLALRTLHVPTGELEGGLLQLKTETETETSQVNLKEDYRRWKSNRGEFSFCQFPSSSDIRTRGGSGRESSGGGKQSFRHHAPSPPPRPRHGGCIPGHSFSRPRPHPASLNCIPPSKPRLYPTQQEVNCHRQVCARAVVEESSPHV